MVRIFWFQFSAANNIAILPAGVASVRMTSRARPSANMAAGVAQSVDVAVWEHDVEEAVVGFLVAVQNLAPGGTRFTGFGVVAGAHVVDAPTVLAALQRGRSV